MPIFAFLAFVQDAAAPAAGTAPAGAAPSGPGGLGEMLIPLGLCAVVIWFFMILPEKKARKKHEAMLGAMSKGDKVITSSGLYGTVTQVQEGVVTLQVDEGVRLKFAVSAVKTVLGDEPVTEKSK